MATAVDTYVIYEFDDTLQASVVRGAERVREYIGQFTNPRVERITDGHFCRDVTADFVPEPQPHEDSEESYAIARAHRRYERSQSTHNARAV